MDLNQRMYIGPAIPGVVKQGMVFLGDLPKELTNMAEKVPSIKNLVVSVGDITRAARAVKEQGSVEYVSCQKVLDYLKGVK